MADAMLAERGPLAGCVTAGRHGRAEGEAGVTLRVLPDMLLVTLLGGRTGFEGLRASAEAAGLALPSAGRVSTGVDFDVLWAGPDQWLVAAERGRDAAAGSFVNACRGNCTVVDQSDGRLVVEVAGPKARQTLAKGLPVDLHPRAFQPGVTALTVAAGIAVQIWQVDDKPTFRLAAPRSFAESFWRWLLDAAAEYGVHVDG